MRLRLYSVISILLFSVLYCFTTICVLVVLILAFLHLKDPIRFLYRFWAKSVFLIIVKKFRVYGIENIDKNDRYILVANHSSLFDIVAIISFYPGVTWFGHERLLKVPVFSKLLKLSGYIPFKEPTIKNTRQMLGQLGQKIQKQLLFFRREPELLMAGSTVSIKDLYIFSVHLMLIFCRLL
jgi:1-acyl-sn-glycerol-3-phosphate acyltransferase